MTETVTVSRPSKWGNPFRLGHHCESCGLLHAEKGSTIPCFEAYLAARLVREPDFIEPLRGKRLLCHDCPEGAPTCHARVYERLLQ